MEGEHVTQTADRLDQALTMIDGGLSDLQSREIMAASEVADLLLDLRLLLMGLQTADEPVLST